MSKKKIYHKYLVVGFFYLHNDSKGGHPCLLYKKNDQKNLYYIVIFTSKHGKKRRILKNNIDKNKSEPSYVLLNPKICRRQSLCSKVLTDFKINKEDKYLIMYIQRKK